MIKIEVTKTNVKVITRETLTVGQVNSVPVSFTFSSEWIGLLRIAVFTTGKITRCVILDDTNECFVPPEVTSHAGDVVFVGVHGTQSDGTVILPSINARLDCVRESADPKKDTGSKSISILEQVLLSLDKVKKEIDNKADANGVYTKEQAYSKGETDVLIQDAILNSEMNIWDDFYPRYMIDDKIGYINSDIAELVNSIGNIDVALDELHNYATSLIGGEA